MSQQRKTKTMSSTYSKVTQALLRNAMTKYDIRESDGPVIPGPKASVLNPPPGKIGIYLEFFECGLRIPVTKFVSDLLSFYEIHLCQLKPNSVSRVVAFELLVNSYHVRNNLDKVLLFRIFYRISMDGDCYTFSQRANMPALITHLRDSIKGWKERFIWVDEDAVPVCMTFRSGEFENHDPAIDYTTMGPTINTAVNAYSAHPVFRDKFPISILTIGGVNTKCLRDHPRATLSLYLIRKGKKEECTVSTALEKGYTESQLSLMVDDTPLGKSAGGLVDEETIRIEEGDNTEMCADHGSTEVLSSPVSKSPPSKPWKKRSFESIVRGSFNPLGKNASAPPVPTPALTMPMYFPQPPSFGVGYTPHVPAGGFAGFAGFGSGSSTVSTMGAGPSTPVSTFCPSWGITSDADGQDPTFPSEFSLHAFPHGMTSRLDGLEY